MLGGYGDGPIGTAHDGALVVKGIGGAEIQDKPRVLGRASEGEGGASLDAEGFVGLGAGDTRSRFKFLVLYVWRYYEYFCQHASDNWGVGSASRPAFAASDCQKGRQELTKFSL